MVHKEKLCVALTPNSSGGNLSMSAVPLLMTSWLTMAKMMVKKAKAVSYSGFTKKQSIQNAEKRQRFNLSGDIIYNSENRNLDICVSGKDAHP